MARQLMGYFILTWISSIDNTISNFLATSEVNLWLKKVIEIITHLGDGWIWISVYLISFIFLVKHFLDIVFPAVTAEITGLLIIIPIRYGVKRNRPDKTYKTNPYTPWNKYSFPSGHSVRSFILAVVIGNRYSNTLAPLLIAACIISLSRVCLAKHYLSDVLAGASIGSLLGIVFAHLLS